jgi:hypothetical protein
MRKLLATALAALAPACRSSGLAFDPPEVLPGPVLHVVHVSVDGLHPGAIDVLGPLGAPTFHRLRREGAWTSNARTDPDLAATLPDHACQLTGRPVFGADGHHWLANTDPGWPGTLHLLDGDYVASVFDVVHDSGFSTVLFADKDKFELFRRTWGAFGAPDEVGLDNGTSKLDVARVGGDMELLVRQFLATLSSRDPTYAFLHLRQPDSTGHSAGWDLAPGSRYLAAVATVDAVLGRILVRLETDPGLAGASVLIVTADHAGDLGTTEHVLLPQVGRVESGIIPFHVWGVGVDAGADLYALNAGRRTDPGASIPPMSGPQPIRNGEAGNLALQLLGLPPIPDSTINARRDLRVAGPGPAPRPASRP